MDNYNYVRIIIGAVAAIGVYWAAKKWCGKTSNDNVSRHKSLSYEDLMDLSKKMITKNKWVEKSDLKIFILPNAKFIEYLSVDPSVKNECKLSEDDIKHAILLSIEGDGKILVKHTLVVEFLTEDYYKIIPQDKVYIKKVKIK